MSKFGESSPAVKAKTLRTNHLASERPQERTGMVSTGENGASWSWWGLLRIPAVVGVHAGSYTGM